MLRRQLDGLLRWLHLIRLRDAINALRAHYQPAGVDGPQVHVPVCRPIEGGVLSLGVSKAILAVVGACIVSDDLSIVGY